MDVAARIRFARMSPLKGRALARSVQGLPVEDALKITQFTAGKVAALVGKTLKSAIANAEKNAKLSVDDLVVKLAVIEEGPRLRRSWSRSRGGYSPILKRMSHVRVVLTDGKDEDPVVGSEGG